MSEQPLELLLFDLDGTLYRTTDLLPLAYDKGIRSFNQKSKETARLPSTEAILDQVGNPVDEIYRNLFSYLSSDAADQLANEVEGSLVDLIRKDEGELIEGVEGVLENLRNKVPMGIVTNARRFYLEAVAETYGFDRWFERMLCLDDVTGQKKAIMVRSQLNHFGVEPDRTLLVGDRFSDLEAARETGVDFVGCKFGYGQTDEFDEEQTIRRFPEILELTRVRNLSGVEG